MTANGGGYVKWLHCGLLSFRIYTKVMREKTYKKARLVAILYSPQVCLVLFCGGCEVLILQTSTFGSARKRGCNWQLKLA